jgi:hypothetical protein
MIIHINLQVNMPTIMFVERHEDEGRMCIGFQLNKENFYRVPKGKVRIARFEDMFWPKKNRGYYGDIYMKQFVRKWKKITKENIQRRKDRLVAKDLLKNKMCFDTLNHVIEFL